MSTIRNINISLEIFGGLLSLIFILCLSITSFKKDKLEMLYIRILSINTLVLFCDAAAWLFKGHTDTVSFFIVRIANFCTFSFSYILLAVFTDYLVSFVATKAPKMSEFPSRIMWFLTLLAVGLVVISQFNNMYYVIDENNVYHRRDWFWISQMSGIFCMLINGGMLFKYRKFLKRKDKAVLWACILMPAAAMLIQTFIYGIALLYLATTLSAICVYISIQVEQSRILSQKELELEKSRTAVMLSQIRPHFLYNALNTIHYLCRTRPEKAAEAVENFSGYLRGNLDSLAQENLIPFRSELKHLNNYLNIEKLRFPDITIILDLKTQEFLLPVLTLQPLVENAIRYGVTQKEEEGGIVTISTWENDSSWFLQVADNGVGIDFEQIKDDNRSHIGIINTKRRIEYMCSGTLSIASEKGKGTCVLITIPKEGRDYN